MHRLSRSTIVFAACIMLPLLYVAILMYVTSQPVDPYANYQTGGYFGCSCTAFSALDPVGVVSTPATGRGDIYVASLNTKSFSPFVTTSDTEYLPISSSNQRVISFVRRRNSGGAQIWTKDRITLVEKRIAGSRTGDVPTSISDDGKWLVLERTRTSGGLERDIHSILVSTDTGVEIDLGYGAEIDPPQLTVYSIQYREVEREIVAFNLMTQKVTRLCSSDRVWPIDNKVILVGAANAALVVSGIDGSPIRILHGFEECRTIAISGDWVGGTRQDNHGIIIQRHDGSDAGSINVSLPQAGWVITSLKGSSFGFTAVICSDGLGNAEEYVVTTSPPFQDWKWRFSATNFVWR